MKELAVTSGEEAVRRSSSTGSKADLAVAAASTAVHGNLRRVPDMAPPIKGWPLDCLGKAGDSSLLETKHSGTGFSFPSYRV